MPIVILHMNLLTTFLLMKVNFIFNLSITQMFKILCLLVNMNRSLTLMILNLLFTLHHKSMKMSIKSSNHNWIKNCKKRCKAQKKKDCKMKFIIKTLSLCKYMSKPMFKQMKILHFKWRLMIWCITWKGWVMKAQTLNVSNCERHSWMLTMSWMAYWSWIGIYSLLSKKLDSCKVK